MTQRIPEIKICGLTRECDIDYINEAHPEYIGFVFAKSRRRISGEAAALLKRRLKRGITAVGVFVEEDADRVLRLVKSGTIDVVQLHGEETPAYVERIKRDAECPVIKAVKMGNMRYGEDFYRIYAEAGADLFLFDSARTGAAGGTGETFEWSRLPRIPYSYFLAGGLNTDNIEAAVDCTSPYGVDISSGVETGGVKDREKILEIIRRIRNV